MVDPNNNREEDQDPDPRRLRDWSEWKYHQAILRHRRGAYGETLQLLSEITNVDPSFPDRENLRARIAQALADQRRDLIFEQAERRALDAVDQGRWEDLPGILSGLDVSLAAENLALTADQRAATNRWQLQSGRHGRPRRSRQSKQRSKAGARAGVGRTFSQRPRGPNKRRWYRILTDALHPFLPILAWVGVAAFVIVIFVVGFSGSDGGRPVPPPTEEQNPEQIEEGRTGEPSAQPITDAAGDSGVDSSGMDRYRSIWADERRMLIDELTLVQRVGISFGNFLEGPPGVLVDLSDCPDGWRDTSGVRGGVVHIANTFPLSGAIVDYSGYAEGMVAYFDEVNRRGGIGPLGLEVELSLYDDGFIAATTAEIVDELLIEDGFLAITTFGTPTSFAVSDRLNEACVPQPMVQSNHPAWSDPGGRPWTTGLTMSQATEAWLWGSWIEQQFTRPVTVGALVMDNQFGLAYEQSFARYAEKSSVITDVTFVRHDPAAVSVDGAVAELAALEPTVFIAMTAGNPCLLAIGAAADTGLADTAEARITTSGCADLPAYVTPAGSAADGWLTFGGGVVDLVGPNAADGIYPRYVRSVMADRGVNPNDAAFAEGFGLRGWALHQVLELAAGLDGGLTRSNLLIAQWGLRELTAPMLMDGVEFGTYGMLSPSFIEGSEVSRFDTTAGAWVVEDTIDRAGVITPCRWVPDVGCR